jgi:hypothetical protein
MEAIADSVMEYRVTGSNCQPGPSTSAIGIVAHASAV